MTAVNRFPRPPFLSSTPLSTPVGSTPVGSTPVGSTLIGMAVTGMALALALALAGCGQASSNPAGGTVTAQPSGSTSEPPADSAPADLTIVVNDGSGTETWHLTCDPAGGTHPDPQTACRVLAANGAKALPPVPADLMCTQIYGGKQTARISGTWRGTSLDAQLSRTNGCEIARWDALLGLLPRGGA